VFTKILLEKKLDDSLLPRLRVSEDEADPCWLVVCLLLEPPAGHSQVSVDAMFIIRGPYVFLDDLTQGLKFHGIWERN
jgi:hypothetical protein